MGDRCALWRLAERQAPTRPDSSGGVHIVVDGAVAERMLAQLTLGLSGLFRLAPGWPARLSGR